MRRAGVSKSGLMPITANLLAVPSSSVAVAGSGKPVPINLEPTEGKTLALFCVHESRSKTLWFLNGDDEGSVHRARPKLVSLIFQQIMTSVLSRGNLR
jgi:hypothetical protein